MKKIWPIITVFLLLACCSCGQAPEPAPVEQKAEEVEIPPPPPEVLEAIELLNYWQDDKDPERRNAAIVLGLFAHPFAVDAANSHMLADRDPLIRATCAWAAGKIGDIRSMPQLQKALEDQDQRVRLTAITALARFNDPDSKNSLLHIIQNTGGVEGMAAFAALGGMPNTKIADIPRPAFGKAHKLVTSAGKTFYVDATSGNDDNPGTDTEPVRTLAKGISFLKAGRGDTLMVTPGSKKRPFREKLVIGPDQSGIPGAPTTIRNWPGKPAPVIYGSEQMKPEPGDDQLIHLAIGQRVLCVFLVYPKKTIILDPVEALDKLTEGSFFYDEEEKSLIVLAPKSGLAGAKIEASVRDDAISVDKAHYIQIEGFTVAYAQDTGIDFANSHHGLIRNATVHDCDRHGIFFFYSPFGTILDSDVSRCRYQGISIRSSSSTIVYGNKSHDNIQDGVLFLYDSDGCAVNNCKITNNKRGIGFIENSDLGRVFDNSFNHNGVDVEFDSTSTGRLFGKGAK